MNRPFDEVFYPALLAVFVCISKIVLPVVLSVMLVGTLANLIQVGFLFSMKAAMPKMSNMNPQTVVSENIFHKKSWWSLSRVS